MIFLRELFFPPYHGISYAGDLSVKVQRLSLLVMTLLSSVIFVLYNWYDPIVITPLYVPITIKTNVLAGIATVLSVIAFSAKQLPIESIPAIYSTQKLYGLQLAQAVILLGNFAALNGFLFFIAIGLNFEKSVLGCFVVSFFAILINSKLSKSLSHILIALVYIQRLKK